MLALMVVTVVFAAISERDLYYLVSLPASLYGAYVIHRWWTARD